MVNVNVVYVKQDRHRWQNQIRLPEMAATTFTRLSVNPHFQPPKPPTWPGKRSRRSTPRRRSPARLRRQPQTREAEKRVSRTAWEAPQGTPSSSAPPAASRAQASSRRRCTGIRSIRSYPSSPRIGQTCTRYTVGLPRRESPSRVRRRRRRSMSSRRVSPGSKS